MMEMFTNPKSLNTEVKVFFMLVLPDLVILVGSSIAGLITSSMLNMSGGLVILNTIVFFVFGIALCTRTASKDRLLFKLIHTIKMDGRTYRSIEL